MTPDPARPAERHPESAWPRRALVSAVVLVLGACGSSPGPADTTAAASLPPTATAEAPQDVWTRDAFSALETGSYFIDADLDPSTPLRVVFEMAVAGWKSWIGAARFGPGDGHVGVSITTVVNLVTHGCRDHLAADPPVGPTVDDLADALAELEPFEVTSAPEVVTAYGYRGLHLELTVPDLPMTHEGFTGCVDGNLASWIAPMDAAEPGDAFYGYTGPGYTEEFWILDVEGTRLMIAAERSAGSPAKDLADLRDILGSIRIEP